MNAYKELCPAYLYDNPGAAAPERVVCVKAPPIREAWTFLCFTCLTAMLNAKARREEWKLED